MSIPGPGATAAHAISNAVTHRCVRNAPVISKMMAAIAAKRTGTARKRINDELAHGAITLHGDSVKINTNDVKSMSATSATAQNATGFIPRRV